MDVPKQALQEVFPDQVELRVAMILKEHVLKDIGKSPFLDAMLSGIVWNAYTALRILEDEQLWTFDDVERAGAYCEERRILERLKGAGHIQSGGFCAGIPLYMKKD